MYDDLARAARREDYLNVDFVTLPSRSAARPRDSGDVRINREAALPCCTQELVGTCEGRRTAPVRY